MVDKNKVIKELKAARLFFEMGSNRADGVVGNLGCKSGMKYIDDTLELLKEQEVRELTVDEWREWKTNPKRDPICELWENDTSPMWILNPNDVHEPALLMGKLKLFTGKPNFDQCKEVEWDD